MEFLRALVVWAAKDTDGFPSEGEAAISAATFGVILAGLAGFAITTSDAASLAITTKAIGARGLWAGAGRIGTRQIGGFGRAFGDDLLGGHLATIGRLGDLGRYLGGDLFFAGFGACDFGADAVRVAFATAFVVTKFAVVALDALLTGGAEEGDATFGALVAAFIGFAFAAGAGGGGGFAAAHAPQDQDAKR